MQRRSDAIDFSTAASDCLPRASGVEPDHLILLTGTTDDHFGLCRNGTGQANRQSERNKATHDVHSFRVNLLTVLRYSLWSRALRSMRSSSPRVASTAGARCRSDHSACD